MYNYLIVGAGIYGAVLAQQTKVAGKSVALLIFERTTADKSCNN